MKQEQFTCYLHYPKRIAEINAIIETADATKGKDTSLLEDIVNQRDKANKADKTNRTNKIKTDNQTVESSPYSLCYEKQIYPLHYGKNYVGRDPKNDVVIDDEHISRQHAVVLVHTDGRAELYDLKSLNWTKINGKSLENQMLNPGDKITLAFVYDLVFDLSEKFS